MLLEVFSRGDIFSKVYKLNFIFLIMNCFIKKIFNGNTEEELVHSQFIKFSKGEFGDRAMVRVKNSKGKYTVATTSEYAKDFIMYLAEKLGDEKVRVTGAIISTLDLEGEFDYVKRKMAMGVKKYMIDKEMSGNELIELCNKVQKAFFGLSFSVGDTDLKISPKSPKSAKGAGSQKKEDAKAKIDFIKIKTSDKELVDNLCFGVGDFNKCEIKHDFVIEKIIMPETDEKDFAKIREMAKREGKLIRRVEVDGRVMKKEVEFVA